MPHVDPENMNELREVWLRFLQLNSMLLPQVYSHPFIKEPLPPGQILSTVYIIEKFVHPQTSSLSLLKS